MDRIAGYQELVKQAFKSIAEEIPEESNIVTEIVLDDVRNHYEILQTGWEGDRRVHGSLAHCDIRNGKIYVEHDGTDFGIADYLVEKGASCEEIVLGYRHPDLRDLTPFALA